MVEKATMGRVAPTFFATVLRRSTTPAGAWAGATAACKRVKSGEGVTAREGRAERGCLLRTGADGAGVERRTGTNAEARESERRRRRSGEDQRRDDAGIILVCMAVLLLLCACLLRPLP